MVVLDDWVDGVTGTPDEVFAELGQGMGGMDMGGTSGSGTESHDMHSMGKASDGPSPSVSAPWTTTRTTELSSTIDAAMDATYGSPRRNIVTGTGR